MSADGGSGNTVHVWRWLQVVSDTENIQDIAAHKMVLGIQLTWLFMMKHWDAQLHSTFACMLKDGQCMADKTFCMLLLQSLKTVLRWKKVPTYMLDVMEQIAECVEDWLYPSEAKKMREHTGMMAVYFSVHVVLGALQLKKDPFNVANRHVLKSLSTEERHGFEMSGPVVKQNTGISDFVLRHQAAIFNFLSDDGSVVDCSFYYQWWSCSWRY